MKLVERCKIALSKEAGPDLWINISDINIYICIAYIGQLVDDLRALKNFLIFAFDQLVSAQL